MKKRNILYCLVAFWGVACSPEKAYEKPTDVHHIAVGEAGKKEEPKPVEPPNEKPHEKPNNPIQKGGSTETPKEIENPTPPTARCVDAEHCIRELENEKDEAKRKAIIDALAPMFDSVQVIGSRGTQVGIYTQERGNLWLGIDKIGDNNYEFVRREGKKIILRMRV